MRSRLVIPVLLSLPGLVLAVAGLFHPHHLAPDTADRWYVVHLAGLLAFPLVGVALAVLVRGRTDPLAWLVRVTAFGFAVLYTALDVVYGVAAGDVVRHQGPGYHRSADFSAMLRTAVDLGEVGSWCLLACGVALVVDLVRRHGWAGLAVVVVPVGAWLVRADHIFAPTGVVGIALVGLGTGVVAWMVPETRRPSHATSESLAAS